jgi:Leucine-rich repeat (LRR) protein
MNSVTLNLFGTKFDYELLENPLQKYLNVLSSNQKHIVYTNDTLCGPGNFSKFRCLKSVILTNNEITNINELPSTVEYLDISNNKFTEFSIRQSMVLNNLKYLNISNNDITDFIQWNMPLEKVICYGNPNLKQINFKEGLTMLDCDYLLACNSVLPYSLQTLYICGEERPNLLYQLKYKKYIMQLFYGHSV